MKPLLDDRMEFWKTYERMIKMLLGCNHTNSVTKQDKKELEEDIKTPLERNHLNFLLKTDENLKNLKAKAEKSGLNVYIEPIFYGFGAL